ncbi:hypothetical protein GCM10009836_30520 [Pseudonocardia ailaonensis]|uniref:Spherulation-specific family 4 protein n=1 Tax=Pseudonocardia ailaonensis TaxID=367279 RepID=A0ABN2N258_9PSEU
MPAYFHPEREAADWARLAAADLVVVNPASGPGTGDPAYRAAIPGLPGVVAGYVDTDYARRPIAAVRADAAAHRRLHGVGAVFLDRVTSGPEDLEYYAVLAAELPRPLILNPGVRPDPGYLALADVVVTFEGDWAAHRALTGPDPVGTTWHLVHGVPVGEQEATLRRAAALGASLGYATDRRMPNPWDGLPAGWAG